MLDPLGNINEIYPDLTMMTLLNLNHFSIIQAELCLKRTFLKESFMFHVYYHIFDIYENPRSKNFINLSCPKHSKIIN